MTLHPKNHWQIPEQTAQSIRKSCRGSGHRVWNSNFWVQRLGVGILRAIAVCNVI
ncbi:hypothetical protein [Nostoc sp. NMS4]|uniref:hypothetical protein n=1 Tax=Nostoc sp. NMS4 TaxID=2815390 RepID=UPI0025DE4D00|nr:hypothetical protein [Nostoc sp. NMS4]MBN3925252.1 hypothetical protein [Nostoc sp. NMS4]